MKEIISLRILLLLQLIIISSCQNESIVSTKYKPFISPPVKEWDVPFTTFEFNSKEGGTFHTSTGSSIFIPSNALETLDGKEINGTVTLNFREFHDGIDFWSSGIPMEYDSAGKHTFASAGMFEINAHQNSEKLKIKQGYKVKVLLASYKNDAHYNHYLLDTTQRNWKYLNSPPPIENEYKKELLEKQNQEIEKLKNQSGEKYFVLDYKALIDVYTGSDQLPLTSSIRNKIESLSKDKAMKTSFSEKGIRWWQLRSYGNMINFQSNSIDPNLLVWERLDSKKIPSWYVGPQKSTENIPASILCQNDPDTPYPIQGKEIAVLFPQGKNTFELRSIDAAGNLHRIKIKPYKTIREFLKVDDEHLKSIYGKEWEVISNEKQRAELMSSFVREFELEGFGIYNCDRFLSRNDIVKIKASFIVEDSINNPWQRDDVIFLPSVENALMHNYAYLWESMPILPDTAMVMFALSAEQKILLLDKNTYGSLPWDEIQSKKRYAFTLKASGQKPTSGEELRALLGFPKRRPLR